MLNRAQPQKSSLIVGMLLAKRRINKLTKHYSIINIINVLTNYPVYNAIYQERRELEKLTKEQLKDIGLDKVSAQQEINRQFLDVPPDRLKRR